MLIPLKREKLIMVITIISAMVNIVLNLLLIPRWGENAAAVTTVIAEALVFILTRYYAKKKMPVEPDGRIVITAITGCLGIALYCILVGRFLEGEWQLLLARMLGSIILYGAICMIGIEQFRKQVLLRFGKG